MNTATELIVPNTAGAGTSVASGRLPDPIQTFTVGTAAEASTDEPPVAVPGPKLVFLDIESTSLRHDRRAWEIGLIVREPASEADVAAGRTPKDVEATWFVGVVDLDLGNADLMSLKIGRFFDRHPQERTDRVPSPWNVDDELDVMQEIEVLLRGAIIVGAVVNFDTETLATRMRANGICPAWDHHIIEIESFAAGHLRMAPPWKLDTFLTRFGIADDPADRHTALGDARRVRDLYDAVMADAGATA